MAVPQRLGKETHHLPSQLSCSPHMCGSKRQLRDCPSPWQKKPTGIHLLFTTEGKCIRPVSNFVGVQNPEARLDEGSVRGQSPPKSSDQAGRWTAQIDPGGIFQGLFGAGPSAGRTYLVDQPTSRISSARIHTDSDCCAFDLAPTTKVVSWNIILVFLDQKHEHIKKGHRRSLGQSALALALALLLPFSKLKPPPSGAAAWRKKAGGEPLGTNVDDDTT